MRRAFRLLSTATLPVFFLAGIVSCAHAQTAAAVTATARVTAQPDFSQKLPMSGYVPDWANSPNDLGSLNAGTPLTNLHLILARAPQVEAAFQQLLLDQQNPASPRYHQWLTPEQSATQYGIAPADLEAVATWLNSQGLTVDNVAAGGVFITFSGSAIAVQNAFSIQIHNFTHESATRYSTIIEPSIPAALTGIIRNIAGLSEHYSHINSRRVPAPAAYSSPGSNRFQPETTFTSGAHALAPGDFNTIYDINSTISSGFSGTGLRVVNLINSRVAAADITAYQSLFGVTAPAINTVVLPSSTDPGVNTASEGEADLDVQRIMGTAPGATIDLLVFATLSNTNIFSALQYEISTLNDATVNMSFGSCDSGSGVATQESSFDSYYQSATAQGISLFASSGDNGAAACNSNYTTIPTVQTLSTNLLCASSYITCVGGTEFADTASPSSYWSSSNNSSTKASALGYIPEGAWNEPSYVNNNNVTVYDGGGTGGGVSRFPKPTYQSGTGVPADGFRDLPDISFSASDYDGYLICETDIGNNCSTGSFQYIIAGTSASSPSMAAITAIIDQKLGSRQGNLNPLLYSTFRSTPAAFNDATPTSSGIGSSCTTATPSLCNNSTPTSSSLSGGLAGYPLTTGYDLATGLGSLDVAKFLAAANTVTKVSTSVALTTVTPNPATVAQTVTLTATLTPGTSASTPTGTVTFYSSGTQIGTTTPSISSTSPYTATLTTTFATAGTYAITATYSGDTNFTTSSTTVSTSLVVNTASYTVTPASASYSLSSGATTGNTDLITLSSQNAFAGTVSLTCTVTNVSGTAAGTCALSPTSAALTSGSSASSTLTINTTAGTSGSLNVSVSGTSGTTVVASSNIVVTLTTPGFTIQQPTGAALIATVSGSNLHNTTTATITPTNGFTGTVNFTCAVNTSTAVVIAFVGAAPTCSATSVVISGGTAGTTTVVLSANVGTSGDYSLTLTGTSGSLTATNAIAIPAQVTAAFLTAAITGVTPSNTVSSGTIATGTVTIAGFNNFTGSVALSCAGSLTSGTGGAPVATTCSVNPTSVTLASNGTATATVNIPTTIGIGGTLTATVTATGTTTGAVNSTSATASAIITVVAPSFAVFATPTSLNFTSGATTGNTSSISATSINGFSGPVNLSCNITTVSGGYYAPTCTITSPVTLTSGSTTTATLTIASTTAHSMLEGQPNPFNRPLAIGGTFFAALLFLPALRRRRNLRYLAVFALMLTGITALTGCGGSSTPAAPATHSSSGSYTVTVSATGTTTGATAAYTAAPATVTVTIN